MKSRLIGTTPSDHGPLQYIAGLYYVELENTRGNGTPFVFLGDDFLTIATRQVSPAIALIAQPGDWIGGKSKWESETVAAFGQGTYSFTEDWQLMLGLRYTSETKDADLHTTTFSSSVAQKRVIPTFVDRVGAPIDDSFNLEDNSVTWMASLRYFLTEDTMVFAAAATGSNSGGFNGVSGSAVDREFSEETTSNYELGIKSQLLDDRLKLNATAFYAEFDDLQFLAQNPKENIRVLSASYRAFADDVHKGVAVPPAAEWLLDNFHLVVSEALAVRHDLPYRYYRKLPRLAAREDAGRARVHAMALELIRHGDGRLDAGRLARFVLAFQTIAPSTIGELWAWPSMLKLALIENLRLLTDGMLAGRGARLEADLALARLEHGHPPGSLPDPLPSAFVAQLRQRMREHDPRASPLAAAVEEVLAASGTTPEDAVRSENQRQATDQVSIGNTITSLRFCSTLDWRRFVDLVSPMEKILRRDPARVYPRMELRQPRLVSAPSTPAPTR